MTLKLAIVAALATASPAAAHTDAAFHTHGIEWFLVIAAIGVAVLIARGDNG